MSPLETFLLIMLLAFVCEWIDSALGMGYGTILSPTLLILGFPALVVVPSILISQACGGLSASYFHHRFQNAHFTTKDRRGQISDDLRSVLWITSLGVLASICASFVGIKVLSKTMLSTYIGTLVFMMGFFILIGFTFRYSVRKMVLVGVVSAFNKGLSGGGFGPLVTGGQVVLGSHHRNAVAVTTLSEGPICIGAFVAYWAISGIERWDVTFALTIGALLASPIGAYTTRKLAYNLRNVVALVLMSLGALTLLKVSGYITISLSL